LHDPPACCISRKRSANFIGASRSFAGCSRYGGDCYAYALVALGFIDLVIETELKRWDIAPIIPIIEGAGASSQIGNGDRVWSGAKRDCRGRCPRACASAADSAHG